MPSKKSSSIIPDYANASKNASSPVVPEAEVSVPKEVESEIKEPEPENVVTKSVIPEVTVPKTAEPEVKKPEVEVAVPKTAEPEVITPKVVVPAVVVTKPVEVEKETHIKKSPIESTIPLEVIPLEKRNSMLYKAGIALFLIITVGTVGVFYLRTKISTVAETEVEETEIEEAPALTVEADIEPVAEVNLSRDEITLEILNGTSTGGLAGKKATIFEDLGYKVPEVGNADDSTTNKLYVKTGLSDQLNNLLEDVEKELDIQEITEEIDDLDTTARIILGS